MRIISVSGSSKETGKSSLATYLVSGLKRAGGLKVSVHDRPDPGGPLEVDPTVLSRPDTDTGKLLGAGAEKVVWLRSTPETLVEDLPRALEHFPEDLPILVEGNTVTHHIRPLLAAFMMSIPQERFKPSAHTALETADVVLLSWGEAFGGYDCWEMERELKRLGVKKVLVYRDAQGRKRAFRKTLVMAARELGGNHLKQEIPKEVLEAVEESSLEGRITCTRAHEIAAELEVEVRLVGEAADLQKIKIVECELGCF